MRCTAWMIGLTSFAMSSAMAADVATIDWAKVPATTVPLFYPGQSSYEWLRKDHPGAQAVQADQACVTCHKGQENKLGTKLVKAGPLEPTPVEGKPGHVDLKVQAAYDATNAYLRFEWKTSNPYPGTEHQYLRFDGTEWKVYGYPKLDKVVREGKEPGIYEDRLSLMVDDGKVPGFASQGCWLSCHDGQRDMKGAVYERRCASQCVAESDQQERPAQISARHPHRPG